MLKRDGWPALSLPAVWLRPEPLTFHIIRRMQMRKFLTIMMVAASLSTTDIVLADEAGSCHFHGKKIAKEETVSNCAADRKELLLWTARLTRHGT